MVPFMGLPTTSLSQTDHPEGAPVGLFLMMSIKLQSKIRSLSIVQCRQVSVCK